MNVLDFDSKPCHRVRRQLDAYLSNELLVETTSELLKHLEGCEACSGELESSARVREALQKAIARQLPPAYLREAIHQRLRSAQPRFGFHVTTWMVALASLALVLVAGQQWLRLWRGRQVVASVLTLGVSDHLHCAIQAHNYPEVANPPDQLRQKLGPEYAGLLPVVEDTGVAGFETNEYFGFVVSDLGQDEMIQLAAWLAPALRNALSGSTGTEKAAAPALLIASVLTRPGAEYNSPRHYQSARKSK
jgi:putative zinc finger protein